MAKSKFESSEIPWSVFALFNFALLAAVAVLGFLAFLASLEIVQALSAPAVAQSIDSAVRAKYTLVTIRNVWLLVGGVLFLGLIIFLHRPLLQRLARTADESRISAGACV